MGVKSAFLNGELEEEVYVEQHPGFDDSQNSLTLCIFPSRLSMALSKHLSTWYDTLSEFLLENGFSRGVIDKTLFSKIHKNDMILVQVYVYDIIFGSTSDQLCSRFV